MNLDSETKSPSLIKLNLLKPNIVIGIDSIPSDSNIFQYFLLELLSPNSN